MAIVTKALAIIEASPVPFIMPMIPPYTGYCSSIEPVWRAAPRIALA